MQTVTLTIGLPGSGKTTWAKDAINDLPQMIVRVNNDDIREALFPVGHVWKPKDENKVREVRQKRVTEFLNRGWDVILDNTYLNPKTLESTKIWIRQNWPNVHIEEKDFRNVPVHVCIDRDMARAARGERFVGAKAILKMAREARIEDLVPVNPFDPALPNALVSDLDGTLALFGNRRDPYDASRCDIIDEVNKPVADILKMYWYINSSSCKILSQPQVQKIFFLSGRTDKWIAPTKRFLDNAGFPIIGTSQGVPFFELVMRHEGDHRDDAILKKEMYEEHILGKYNVVGIFDDRLKVVRMWKSLGLPVFNMGDCLDF